MKFLLTLIFLTTITNQQRFLVDEVEEEKLTPSTKCTFTIELNNKDERKLVGEVGSDSDTGTENEVTPTEEQPTEEQPTEEQPTKE